MTSSPASSRAITSRSTDGSHRTSESSRSRTPPFNSRTSVRTSCRIGWISPGAADASPAEVPTWVMAARTALTQRRRLTRATTTVTTETRPVSTVKNRNTYPCASAIRFVR